MTARPVYEEPEIEVFAWHFARVEGTLRLACYRTADGKGRLSTEVVDVDWPARQVTTASGRIYHLVDDEMPVHGARVLQRFCAVHGIPIGHVSLVGADVVASIFKPPIPSGLH